MLKFPLDESLLDSQPVVTEDGDVYVLSRRAKASNELVSAMGVRHSLRRLSTASALRQRHDALNHNALVALVQEQLGRGSIDSTDALSYFVSCLAPAVSERDWSDQAQGESTLSQPAQPSHDFFATVARETVATPFPHLPESGLWLHARVWLLQPMDARSGCLHVCFGKRTLGMTGEYILVRTLQNEWRAEVDTFVGEAARRIAERHPGYREPLALRQAREEVARRGSYQVGDLLYLHGNPPRLGHVLPPHGNRTLGRRSNRDLALTAPLTMPPRILYPSLYQLNGKGSWEPFVPPNGLCLGPDPPVHRPESPGLELAAFLRWAAFRIATNGIFHVGDDGP